MQYYTKQQLQGAGAYSHPARVGNWNEDVHAQETLLKDYLHKKDTGTLKLDKHRFRMERALSEVDATVTAVDGFVHFGDILMLKADNCNMFLAVDTEDKDPRPGEYSFTVTGSSDGRPCARNTFIASKYCPPKGAAYEKTYDDNIIRYGQKIFLAIHPHVYGEELDEKGGPEPWYMTSLQVSTTHHSQMARHQEVSVTPKNTYNNAWTACPVDTSQRLIVEGQPVAVGTSFFLEHCATKQYLHCDPNLVYWNDFGQECEVTCHSAVSTRKAQNLAASTQGATPQSLEKQADVQNLFSFVVGSKIGKLPAVKYSEFDPKKILKKLLAQLGKLGANGMASLMKCFKDFDKDGSGNLDLEEFKLTLQFCLVTVSHSEAECLMKFFDKDASGAINAEEFISTLKELDELV